MKYGGNILQNKKTKTILILTGVFLFLLLGRLINQTQTQNQTITKITKTQPTPTTQPTTIPTATPALKTVIKNTFTPTPTVPVYKYYLWKSTDEIHLNVPTQAGYAIAATLRDEKMNIVTNQSDFVYTWTIDDKSLVRDGARSFDGCTQGIQPPCPQDHFSFVATQSGQTVIRVSVKQGENVVAATTFPLIIEKIK